MRLLLGIDFGEKRVGVATCDPELGFALPRETIEVKGIGDAIARIEKLARDLRATELVVGLPLNMDGSAGSAAANAKAAAATLHDALGIPVHLWDERLTTHEAHDLLQQAGRSSKQRRGVVDRVAAQLILQSYIDAHPST